AADDDADIGDEADVEIRNRPDVVGELDGGVLVHERRRAAAAGGLLRRRCRRKATAERAENAETNSRKRPLRSQRPLRLPSSGRPAGISNTMRRSTHRGFSMDVEFLRS